MAYQLNKNYHFVSYAGSGKCLNVYGNEQISNNRNVCLWNKQDTNAQNWVIKSFSGGTKIVSNLNQNYALNYYWGSGKGNPGNCDVYPEAGNDADSLVVFQAVDSNNNIYRIKLKNYNLYLTAKGTADGSDVKWESLVSGAKTQEWKLTLFSGTAPSTGVTLQMPQNLNQKYVGNDAVIRNAGCAVCCACDVASYYRGSNYTLAEMKTAGVYSTGNATCYWGNVPSAGFQAKYDGHTQAEYYAKIRSEITAKRPILIFMSGTYQHWVVAYGYTSTANDPAAIRVLDPCNTRNVNSTVGRDITLKESLDGQGCTSIDFVKCTFKK